MSKSSWQLSHNHRTELEHAVYWRINGKNLFENLISKSNTHISHHSKWQSDNYFQLTEYFVFLGLTEGRWSIRCALVRKVGQMFYTVSEVAKDHLKVSRATVYRLLNQGHLQGVKLRGCTRITSTELERFERMIGGC